MTTIAFHVVDENTFKNFELVDTALDDLSTSDGTLTGDIATAQAAAEAAQDDATVARDAVDPRRKITWYTDFLGDALPSETANGVGSGTGNSITLAANNPKGAVVLKTSSADAAIGANGTGFSLGSLNFSADMGGLVLEARVKIDNILASYFFVGFTDTSSTTVEAPVFLNAADIDSDATNACGVFYDTDGTTAEWCHGGVKADTDTTPAYSGTAPVDDTYATVRVEVSAAGAVQGFIDGVAIGAAVANAVTVTTSLTPIVFCANRGGAVRNLSVDYMWVQCNR